MTHQTEQVLVKNNRPRVVSGDQVRFTTSCAVVGAAAPEPSVAPGINIVREEGVIRAIEIVCRCGEHIRLHCHYDDSLLQPAVNAERSQ